MVLHKEDRFYRYTDEWPTEPLHPSLFKNLCYENNWCLASTKKHYLWLLTYQKTNYLINYEYKQQLQRVSLEVKTCTLQTFTCFS